jgi:hypothetical protein
VRTEKVILKLQIFGFAGFGRVADINAATGWFQSSVVNIPPALLFLHGWHIACSLYPTSGHPVPFPSWD